MWRILSTNVSSGKLAGSKEDCKGKVNAAEAKKAEGASKSTLRMPNPPYLTGKLAWIQWRSLKSQFAMLPKTRRSKASKRDSKGWEAHGEALRMYWSLVDPMECLRIPKASCDAINSIRSAARWRSLSFCVSILSMAVPSRMGAPRSSASLGVTRRKPSRPLGRTAGGASAISSHLLLLRDKPNAAPYSSTIETSRATVSKSPPPETSSK